MKNLSVNISISPDLYSKNPEYAKLASRIVVSNHHKGTSPNFSDVIVRDKYFNKVKDGQKGLVQLLSLLPTSYPGHSILTEDIGEIVPRHKIKCNLDAKHFLIHGRLENSEVRGCSDV